MKKFIVIISTVLLMISNTQAAERINAKAGERIRGTVEKVNLESGWVKINNVKYQVQQGKTKIISGQHKLNLDVLNQGDGVYFRSDPSSFITEIKLIHPVQVNY